MPHLKSPNVGKIPDFKPQRMREIRIFGYAIVTLSDTEVLFLLDLKTIGFFDIKQFYPMVKRLYELGLLKKKAIERTFGAASDVYYPQRY